MNTTVHESIREDLKAYVDGELRLPRRLQLSRHIAGCPDCRKEMEEMKKITHNLFASEGASTLSDPLRSRLLGAIGDHAESGPRASSLAWRRWMTWVYGGAGAVAAASALTFAVTYLSTPHLETASASNAAPVSALNVEAAPANGSFAMELPRPAAKPASSEAVKNSFESSPPVTAAQPKMLTATAGSAVAYQGASGRHAVGAMIGSRSMAPQVQAEKSGDSLAASNLSDYQATSSSYVSRVRKVDNEANLGVEVDDVEAAGDKIGNMVKADGGYIATNNLTIESGARVDHMTLKIPSQDFDSMIAAFSRYGTVVSKNVSGEDITDKTVNANSDEQGQIDQVVETEGKLRAERMSERRRAALEERLDDQRSALAQTRARLGALRKTAALSTVNLTLTEKGKTAPEPPKSTFWNGFGETNQAASAAFQSAVKVPVVAAIWMFALSPIWLPLVLLVRYLTRKHSSHNGGDR